MVVMSMQRNIEVQCIIHQILIFYTNFNHINCHFFNTQHIRNLWKNVKCLNECIQSGKPAFLTEFTVPELFFAFSKAINWYFVRVRNMFEMLQYWVIVLLKCGCCDSSCRSKLYFCFDAVFHFFFFCPTWSKINLFLQQWYKKEEILYYGKVESFLRKFNAELN